MYDQSAAQQQQNVTGYSNALANIIQGIAPGIQSTYDTAAQNQAAFAKGFSDQLQQALGQRASNVSSFLQNVVGAPSSQISQVQGQVAPPAAGDTLYGLQGYIPASTLNEEGAAFTAAAKQLPAAAYAQGLQQIGKVQGAQQAADAKFAEELAKIAGQAPALGLKIQDQTFNQKYKLSQADATQAWRQAQLDFKQAELRVTSAKNAAALRVKIANGYKPDPGLSRIYGYVVDSYGNMIPGANGKKITVKSTSKKGASSAAPPWATGPGGAGSAPLGTSAYNKTVAATAAQKYAISQLSSYGWSNPAEANALDQLWNRESGWNPNAVNSSSGAAGIPQALGHKLPPGYANDYRVQIKWGLDYIKQRYGSPSAAWAHEQAKGWY